MLVNRAWKEATIEGYKLWRTVKVLNIDRMEIVGMEWMDGDMERGSYMVWKLLRVAATVEISEYEHVFDIITKMALGSV